MKKILLSVFILAVLFLCTGWVVKRNLSISSEPSGADIYFDDKLIGKSPVNFDFMWYAKHRIKIEKEGFNTLETTEMIKAPYYMWIPIDLLSDLMPFPIKDERSFSYKLSPRENYKPKEIKEESSSKQ